MVEKVQASLEIRNLLVLKFLSWKPLNNNLRNNEKSRAAKSLMHGKSEYWVR